MANIKYVTIVHENIRSMRANFDSFLVEMSTWNSYPDIIALSEIWVKTNEAGFYNIPGYEQLMHANDSHRAGGVCIFYKTDYISIVQIEKPIFLSADILRIRIIVFSQTTFDIIVVYRLHKSAINQFVHELQNYLCSLRHNNENKNLILLGDCNIDLLTRSNDVDNYRMTMASLGLESLINEPTRVTNISQSCIDHVFVRLENTSRTVCSAEVRQTQVTDHYMTVVRLGVGDGQGGCGRSAGCPSSPSPTHAAVRTRICYATLISLLSTVDWSVIRSQTDASIAYDLFETQLLTCIKACTFEVGGYGKNIKKLKPWITEHLCMRINKRNMLFKKVKQRPHDTHFRNYYFNFRNRLRNDIRLVKSSYYAKRLDSNSRNPKALWNTVKEITGQSVHVNSYNLNVDGEIISAPGLVANQFNKYFLSVVSEVVGDYSVNDEFTNLSCNRVFTDYHERRSFMLAPVSNQEVESAVKTLRNGKSSGIDGFGSDLLKVVYPTIKDVLTFLINLSFTTGTFPEKLKVAVVVPIFKKGVATECSNFRPISLVSVFSKVYEKIMKKRMLDFLNKTRFFSLNQFGFRLGLSTEVALLSFMDKVNNGLNDGKYVSGLFIDIKKAFDTVNHDILLNKLYNCGFRGMTYNWLKSYLSNRKQCVKINGILSEMGEISCGVPQGSVLGASLFIIFINDLCSARFNGAVTAFADDTAFCYVDNSLESAFNQMCNDLNSLNWWFHINRLVLSTEKTTYINFSLRQNKPFQRNLLYKCNNCLLRSTMCNDCSIIQPSTNIKYLGVILDHQLSWKLHVEKVKKSSIAKIRLFYFLQCICPQRVLRSLYFALVNSKLEYGMVCWGGTYLTNLKPLITLQKLFVRVILKKGRFQPSYPCFKELNILPIRSLFIYKVLKIVREESTNIIGINKENRHEYTLRHEDRLLVPRPNLTFFTKTINFIAPRLYNSLPVYIKQSMRHRQYLKKLREWLLSYENTEELLNIII